MKYLFSTLVLLSLVVSCKPTQYADLEDGLYANLETNRGAILLKLEYEKTPLTVANFVSLAQGTNDYVSDSLKGKPYYNGLIFHRVINNFMIQGGCPLGTGAGNPGYKFKDEFPKDENDSLLLRHDGPGVLSMANAGPFTNGSQFFITHKDTPWLDGRHTVFGHVVKGQSVVDSIKQRDTIIGVEIISQGKAARGFDAAREFSTYFEAFKKEKAERMERVQKVMDKTLKVFDENEAKATELPSGLKYVITETKNGDYPSEGAKILVRHAGYFTDGRLFDTSYKEVAEAYETYSEAAEQAGGYEPFESIYSPQASLISGFREGLLKMRIGDKAMLFVPSHLGYGPQGAGNIIPPNSDLVFEIEIVGLVK
jgi:cyclophilin family peptidyl-prolyl cis-trans isomerase